MSETDTEMDRQVGARVQRARERSGLSRAELAGQIKLPEPELNAIELGQSRPDAEVLLDLANALGMPLTELLKPVQE